MANTVERQGGSHCGHSVDTEKHGLPAIQQVSSCWLIKKLSQRPSGEDLGGEGARQKPGEQREASQGFGGLSTWARLSCL